MYKIKFTGEISKTRLKQLDQYGIITYLGNNEYNIEVWNEYIGNRLVLMHSRNGVIITKQF